MPDIETTVCRRCFAVVERQNIEFHRQWHADVEGIESPTSEYGWWGADGKWNRNSATLQDGVHM